ncbi:hypothetical protein FNV43_RR11004 [Rhamnella rubrinervis]|uniref:Uncharacterized protein n=1 Tax=Rhamnella rubrinervis TaxID=2594499 RepID=A0A8K0H4W6_9ROSA|nr:hypothetical protein FNV43_RR11004 [Rhamnella rubrinervis]
MKVVRHNSHGLYLAQMSTEEILMVIKEELKFFESFILNLLVFCIWRVRSREVVVLASSGSGSGGRRHERKEER